MGWTFNPFTGTLDYFLDVDVSSLPRDEVNIMLNSWRIIRNAGSAYTLLMDGWVDGFKDETGVDTSSSTNETYDSSNDLYHPSTSGGAGRDGTISVDASTLTAAGKLTNAFLFGDGGLVEVTDTTDDFVMADGHSLAFWINTTDAGDRPNIFTKLGMGGGIQPTNGWYFKTDGTDVKLGGPDDSEIVLETGGFSRIGDGNWHLIVIALTADTINYYVDNSLINGASYTSPSSGGAEAPFQMGFTTEAGPAEWDGYLDDVRFYNKTCDADDVSDLWNSGSGTAADTGTMGTNQTSHWKFDETSGTTAADSMGSVIINNMTLISNAITAEAAPSTARIMILEDDVDAITLNTDLKAYVSRDGTNYTQITIADEGNYNGTKRILSAEATISSSTGTSMKWKIETLNNKDLDLYGVGVVWK